MNLWKDYIVSEFVELRREGWVTAIETKLGINVAALGATQLESRDKALAHLRLAQEGTES